MCLKSKGTYLIKLLRMFANMHALLRKARRDDPHNSKAMSLALLLCETFQL